MLPNNRTFNGQETYEENGTVFFRSYTVNKSGKFRLTLRVVSIHSPYRQAVAFNFSRNPKFKGKLSINGTQFAPEKKQLSYILPVNDSDQSEVILDLDIAEGYLRLSGASDFLDDYPELIEKISAQTGRSRDQFRGCSYTSGFSAGTLYGNALWVEELSPTRYRFHCNDHQMDDDYDDLIFDMEIADSATE